MESETEQASKFDLQFVGKQKIREHVKWYQGNASSKPYTNHPFPSTPITAMKKGKREVDIAEWKRLQRHRNNCNLSRVFIYTLIQMANENV